MVSKDKPRPSGDSTSAAGGSGERGAAKGASLDGADSATAAAAEAEAVVVVDLRRKESG